MKHNNIEQKESELMTPKELAELLKIPMPTLSKWINARQLPVIKVGRLNRFNRVHINKRLLLGNLLKD
jgi:excisionase family DNA binding protein